MNIDFECTACGKCCHSLRVPLTVAEAINWLKRGHDVEVLCEAIPWPEEPSQDNLQGAHKRRRSFAAMSGELPARIVVTLVGAFAGPCPNLLADLRCGIYEQRPLVCRIYPTEISPFIPFVQAQKACPPQAWIQGGQALLREGKVIDADMLALIQESRDTDASDVYAKQHLCADLNIDSAALSNEGFVVYSPEREVLLAALERQRGKDEGRGSDPGWQIVSNRQATADTLASVGAACSVVEDKHRPLFEYLGFFPASV
jgi:Fe-S-cluster containining protein